MQNLFTLIKKYKVTLIIAAAVVAAFVVAFMSGGSISGLKANPAATAATADSVAPSAAEIVTKASVPPTTEETGQQKETETEKIADTETVSAAFATAVNSVETVQTVPAEASEEEPEEEPRPATDKYKTDPVPSGKPEPIEPQVQTTQDNTLKCTLSISCANALNHPGDLDEEIMEILPADGWLLKPEQFEFTEGESVYDLMVRVCRERKIHFDTTFTPIYNSAYVKGIGNLYEFDCGENSGWMYRVNDWFPNYGVSRYVLKNGDTVSFLYSCDGGFDVGERQ